VPGNALPQSTCCVIQESWSVHRAALRKWHRTSVA